MYYAHKIVQVEHWFYLIFLFSLKSTSYTEISIFYTKYRLHGGKLCAKTLQAFYTFLNRLHGGKLDFKQVADPETFLNRLHGGKQLVIFDNAW